jgi:hypothetical protein
MHFGQLATPWSSNLPATHQTHRECRVVRSCTRATWALIVLVCGLYVGCGNGLADVHAAGSQRLRAAGGVDVDFVRWDLRTPPDVLFMTPERRNHLAEIGADAATAVKHHDVKIAANGDVTQTTTMVVSVLSRAGVENYGNYSFRINAHTSITRIVAAHVRQLDGKLVPVLADSIQIRTADDGNIFSTAFEVVVPFARVRVGSSLVLVTESEFSAAKTSVPWSAVLTGPLALHVDDFKVHVSWAAGALEPRVESNVLAMRCEPSGPRARTCATTTLSPLEERHSAMSILDVLPHVAISTNREWSDLARTVAGFTMDKLTGAPSIQTRLSALELGRSKRDRFEAIHEFVTREVRYLGLEREDGAYVACPSATTLERGYGDCKDMTVLFLDMARLAGLTAWPVLVASKRFDADMLIAPASSYFDHMIACVNLGENEPACVDLTDDSARAGKLSSSVSGAVALSLAGENSKLHTLAAKPAGFALNTTSRLSFDVDGGAACRVHR